MLGRYARAIAILDLRGYGKRSGLGTSRDVDGASGERLDEYQSSRCMPPPDPAIGAAEIKWREYG